jgi:alpha-beta hydrolase superfamily lysophospholipase
MRGGSKVLVALALAAAALVAARVVPTAMREQKLLARPAFRPTQAFEPGPAVVFEQEVVDSADDRLAARWSRPAEGPAHASVFIAHGGQPERIDDWRRVQQRLALHGIEGFAFDFAGFGESTGAATTLTLPRDLRAAWSAFVRRVPAERPVFVLAFSDGCGQALATLDAWAGRARGLVLLSCPSPELAPVLKLPLLEVHGDDPIEHPTDAVWAPIEAFIAANQR